MVCWYLCISSTLEMSAQTLSIDLINSKAIRLLEELESMNIIRIHRAKKRKALKLSERLAGSISAEEHSKMMVELETLRSEWERPI